MSDLSENERTVLAALTEGDDLSCLTVRQAFAYGVALGYHLPGAPTMAQVEGDYQEAIRPLVDDLSIEVQEAMGWDPQG